MRGSDTMVATSCRKGMCLTHILVKSGREYSGRRDAEHCTEVGKHETRLAVDRDGPDGDGVSRERVDVLPAPTAL